MKLTSVFTRPEGGIMAGIGTAIAVYLIYQSSLPPTVDVRMGEPHDANIESARVIAARKSAALVGLVFLFTRDLNTFILSGAALGGIDYTYKHHNAINPATGMFEPVPGSQSVSPMAQLHPLPDYGGYESTG